ncbi:MAG TPA: response regulator [Aquabacterium sp.]|nr:response regulator [Aquabacterium sp.]
MQRASAKNALSVVTSRLTGYAIAWTAVVLITSVWLIQDRLDRHRFDQVQAAQYRLNSLNESLNVTFQQLGALSKALGRQHAILDFLSHIHIEWSSTMSEADRASFTKALLARPDVQSVSNTLRETVSDFQVGQIYVTDPYGTVLADSLFDTPLTTIGANRRTRTYFTEAIENGNGLQFLVGQHSKTPGFFFSARIGGREEPIGTVVVRQDPPAMNRLLGDTRRQLYVTDPFGVVLMSNVADDVLHRVVLPTSQAVADSSLTALYRHVPAALNWLIDDTKVRGRPVMTVTKGSRRYLAISSALDYGHLTIWTLIPQDDENMIMAGWGGGMALVLFIGYAFLGFRAQRAQRIEALTAARQELEDMANALPLTIFRYEQPARGPGRFSFLGKGAEDRFGVSHETLLDDPTLPWRQAKLTPLEPPAHAVEFAVEMGGSTRWLRCESQVSTAADGSRTFNGFWEDITERKHLHSQLEVVFDNAPLGFIYYNESLEVVRYNQAAQALFGAKDNRSLLGMQPHRPPMSPAMDEATLTSLRSSFVEKLQHGEVARFEWRYTRMDGTPFDADVVAMPFVIGDKRMECAIIQDITARKEVEAANLSAQQAAEAAALAKSRFLANMSHEIRTPMNAVLGMTHLALMDELPERARNYIDKAHRAAGNLLQILNDVLDVSKIESGKLELEKADFQLETVISHMADVLGVKAEEKGLELLFTAPPDIPTSLVGDPTRLGQILINLGNNAIKFTSQGEILIGCEVQRMEADHVTLHFWVKDTGIGMSTEQLDRLFQPFVQGDSSTTRQFGGTGLGLTISRQLTELMEGRIWVDSQPGHGSTFHFTARFGMQAQPSSRRALLASELKDKRALLVDDNPAARDVLGEMIRRLGLNVDVANGGEQALALMNQALESGQPHHILLTDWKMPGMDGIAFAKRALEMPPEQRPCVLLVTAFAREEAIKAAQGVPLAGVLTKPVTPSTLLDTLAHSLGQDVAPAPAVRNTSKILQKAQKQLAGARVLLVEDQPLNQELACDLLERAGLSVVTALNGQDALDKLRQEGPFDGVLMDCQMPVMDGYTASQRIRAEQAWAHLPIIAMTASAMASDRERVLQAGMNDHITKPLDLNQMFTIMARWIVPAKPAMGHESTEALRPAIPLTSALDTVDGLARCMGNLDLYRRLVKGFAKTQKDFADRFVQAENDTDQAIHLTHTLKGLAGNIGARNLLAAANELEQALHNDLDHQEALKHTLEELPRVLADIAQLQQADSQMASSAQALVRDPRVQMHWDRIGELIAGSEAQAGDVLQQALQEWPELHQVPAVQQLKKALDQYDFDVAAVALTELRN